MWTVSHLQSFQEQAKKATHKLPAKSSEYKGWHPTGRMLQKWKGAFEEADKTKELSRKARYLLLAPAAYNKPPARSPAKHAGKKRKLTDEPIDEPSKDSCETLPVLPPAAKKARTSPGPLSSKSAAQKLVQQRKFDIVR